MASRTEFLIHDLKFRELSDQLPTNVFVMSIRVTLARTQKRDVHLLTPDDDPIRPPAFPVPVNVSREAPYIDRVKSCIANPAKDFKIDKKLWRFETYVNRMTAEKEAIASEFPGEDERIYLNGVELVEVPAEYAYREDETGDELPFDSKQGFRSVRSDLYDDRAEIYIGRFDKRPSITDEHVRDQLGERAPGDVMQPLRLDSVKRAYAKNHRDANTTKKYFTEGQARQYNDESLAPRGWDADSEVYTQRTFDSQFTRLAQSEFYDPVRFDGHYNTRDLFVPEEATILRRPSAASQ
jgi:hypothetical protein